MNVHPHVSEHLTFHPEELHVNVQTNVKAGPDMIIF